MASSETWELWFPDAAATGLLFARARIPPTAVLWVHAAPPTLTVTVREADDRVQLGLVRLLCQILDVSFNELLDVPGQPPDAPDAGHQRTISWLRRRSPPFLKGSGGTILPAPSRGLWIALSGHSDRWRSDCGPADVG